MTGARRVCEGVAVSRWRGRAGALAAAWLLAGLAACGGVEERPADAGVSADAGAARADAAAPDFSIAPAAPGADVRVTEALALEVAIDRRNGFAEPVVVEVTDLPTGVTASSTTVAGGESRGTLQVDASGATPGASATATLVATAAGKTRLGEVEVFVLGRAGALDTRFGAGGVLQLPVGPLTDPEPGDIVGLPDGGFIVVGRSVEALYAMKLAADGQLDDGFGDGGVRRVSFVGQELSAREPAFVGLLSDGSILLVGSADGDASSTFDSDLLLAKLTPEGDFDSSFAGGGKVAQPMGDLSAAPFEVAVMPDDRLVVVGAASSQAQPSGMLVARFSGGLLDSTFAGNGFLQIPDTGEYATHVAVTAEGDVVVVGEVGDTQAGLVRLNADGTIDDDFGAAGTRVLVDMALGDGGFAVHAGDDGIAIAGFELDPDTEVTTPLFWRMDAGGAFDPDFGTGGELAVSAAEGGFFDLVAGEDRSLTAIGFAGQGSGLLLARVSGETNGVDPAFGTNGVLEVSGSFDINRPPKLAAADRWLLTLSDGEVARVWR